MSKSLENQKKALIEKADELQIKAAKETGALVVGIVTKGKVYLASDSQVTLGGTLKVSRNEESFKIWHPKGMILRNSLFEFSSVLIILIISFCPFNKLSNIEKELLMIKEQTKQNQILSWLDKHPKARYLLYIYLATLFIDESSELIKMMFKFLE